MTEDNSKWYSGGYHTKSPMGIVPVAKIISARPRWNAGSLPKTKPLADRSMKKNARTIGERTARKMISNFFSAEPASFKSLMVSHGLMRLFFKLNTATAALINSDQAYDDSLCLNLLSESKRGTPRLDEKD
jgi:hypothetical protein